MILHSSRILNEFFKEPPRILEGDSLRLRIRHMIFNIFWGNSLVDTFQGLLSRFLRIGLRFLKGILKDSSRIP